MVKQTDGYRSTTINESEGSVDLLPAWIRRKWGETEKIFLGFITHKSKGSGLNLAKRVAVIAFEPKDAEHLMRYAFMHTNPSLDTNGWEVSEIKERPQERFSKGVWSDTSEQNKPLQLCKRELDLMKEDHGDNLVVLQHDDAYYHIRLGMMTITDHNII